ncbi:ATP-binding protein [Streptomyces sp. QTS52]
MRNRAHAPCANEREPRTALFLGVPYAAATASLVIAELTANAAAHGRVRGRDARLALTLTAGTLRIEVTDARGDRLPEQAPDGEGERDGESGRGLLLVALLALQPPHPDRDPVGGEPGPYPVNR